MWVPRSLISSCLLSSPPHHDGVGRCSSSFFFFLSDTSSQPFSFPLPSRASQAVEIISDSEDDPASCSDGSHSDAEDDSHSVSDEDE